MERLDLPLGPKIAIYNKLHELKEELRKEEEEAEKVEKAGDLDDEEYFYAKEIVPSKKIKREHKTASGIYTGYFKPRTKQKKGEPKKKRPISLHPLSKLFAGLETVVTIVYVSPIVFLLFLFFSSFIFFFISSNFLFIYL